MDPLRTIRRSRSYRSFVHHALEHKSKVWNGGTTDAKCVDISKQSIDTYQLLLDGSFLLPSTDISSTSVMKGRRPRDTETMMSEGTWKAPILRLLDAFFDYRCALLYLCSAEAEEV